MQWLPTLFMHVYLPEDSNQNLAHKAIPGKLKLERFQISIIYGFTNS